MGDTSLPAQLSERQPLQDHCGIVAAFSPTDIPFFQTGLRGLQLLQTRGYDGAGFWATDTQGVTHQYKGMGMVNEVFSPEILRLFREIRARMWIYQVGVCRRERVSSADRGITGET